MNVNRPINAWELRSEQVSPVDMLQGGHKARIVWVWDGYAEHIEATVWADLGEEFVETVEGVTFRWFQLSLEVTPETPMKCIYVGSPI